MKPKKSLIDKAKDNGSMDRINMLLSAAHILNCTSNQYAEEAAGILEMNGLMIGRLKLLHNNFLRAADNYFSEFASMVNDEEKKMNMFTDMEEFDEAFRKWARIEKEWKPKEKEDNEE